MAEESGRQQHCEGRVPPLLARRLDRSLAKLRSTFTSDERARGCTCSPPLSQVHRQTESRARDPSGPK